MKDSNFKSFVQDNVIILLGMAIMSIKAIILMPLIIKSVGVETYGGYVLFISMVSITFGFSNLGVGLRYKRYMPSAEKNEQKKQLFYPQFIFSFISLLLISFVFVFFESSINNFLFDNKLEYSSYIIPFYLLTYLLFAQGSDYFRYTGRVENMTFASTAYPYLHILILICWFYFYTEVSVNIIIGTGAFSAFIVGSFCFVNILRELNGVIPIYKFKELIIDIKLGFPLILNVLIDFILSASDRYLISIFISISAVGYYNSAYLLGSLILIVSKGMGTVIPQLLSKSIDSGQEENAIVMTNYSIKLFLMFAIPFVFGSAVLGKSVLYLLANDDVANKSMYVVPIIALASLFLGLFHLLSNVMFVRLKMTSLLKLNVLAALINLSLNLIALPFYKCFLVAAFTTLLSYLVVFILIHCRVKGYWNISYDLTFIFKSIIASFIMSILCWGSLKFFAFSYDEITLMNTLLITLLAIVIYFSSLILLRAFSNKEMFFVKRLLRKAK